MGFRLEDFSMDQRKCTAPWKYIWVNSGFSTCALRKETVTGAQGLYAPPFAAPDTALSFSLEADGHSIEDTGNKGKGDCGLLFAGGTWLPDRIARKGTYHFRTEQGLLSLAVESELVPLTNRAGFLVRICVQNRGEREIALAVRPQALPGHPRLVELAAWDFMPPRAGEDEMAPLAQNVWENREVRATLLAQGCGRQIVPPQARCTCRAAIVLTRAGEAAEEGELAQWQKETEDAWQRRLRLADAGIPQVKSEVPGLAAYYNRSLISGLVCLWENADYITQPFPATSGMDGGSICCYPWDVAGYSARTLVMLLGGKTLDFLKQMLRSGIDSHICMSLDGKGQGWCGYSYSMWSLMHLYWTILSMTGTGWELFDEILALFQAEEARLPEWEDLKDYGRQHNLLEMRTCGYEYIVPSPNAERAWCFDRFADLAERLGREGAAAWRDKAERIRASIRKNLWDPQAKWFRCLHPDGCAETVYSIQMYDALRMGACNDAMTEALLDHLVDGKFLGEYGVSSVSAEDALHYEWNDPDWSGGGSYSGEGPELAEALWKIGRDGLAWDVLRRHFWLGTMAHYIPQEHYCDRPFMPENKRANIIAGVTGLQAILFGLAGFATGLEGTLSAAPRALDGRYEVHGFRHRGHTVDLTVDGDRMTVTLDGKQLYAGRRQRVEIL